MRRMTYTECNIKSYMEAEIVRAKLVSMGAERVESKMEEGINGEVDMAYTMEVPDGKRDEFLRFGCYEADLSSTPRL